MQPESSRPQVMRTAIIEAVRGIAGSRAQRARILGCKGFQGRQALMNEKRP